MTIIYDEEITNPEGFRITEPLGNAVILWASSPRPGNTPVAHDDDRELTGRDSSV